MYKTRNKQSGVASLFIVMFFMLLISIIVIGFVQIVNQDQEQALNADLHRSAYDSAQSGVEDGKRALEQYKRSCITTPSPSADCTSRYTGPGGALMGESCDALQQKLGDTLGLDGDSSEVKITTNSTQDKDLDQAYTCLKVKLNTDDYQQRLLNGNSSFIPMKLVGGVTPASIVINWSLPSEVTNIGNAAGDFRLPTRSSSPSWAGKPAMLRVQLIATPKDGVSMDMQSIDDNAKAVFLYPTEDASGDPISVSSQDASRGYPKFSPVGAKCDPSAAVYLCSATLTNFSLPDENVYVRVTPIYNNASFQIIPINASGDKVQFDGVNPEIDSTGRANNVYRRVISRVARMPADYSAADVTQGICKAFYLADFDTSYGNGSCNPTCTVEEAYCVEP